MTAIALVGCRGGWEITPPPGSALFECFSYTGEDDYYKVNPLVGEDQFYNPILPGWYSDPSVCTNGEGDYFLATSTFSFFPGVPLFHSRDLVNWHQIGHILTRRSQLVNLEGQAVSGGIFAPALSYNPADSTYYMVTTNVGAGNFYVTTTDPWGEWSDPVMLPEVGGIDPSFFFDDNGKAYVLNNDEAPDGKPEYEGHRTIRIQEFDAVAGRTVGPRTILVDKGARPEESPIWIEGPHMYKIDGRYYLMAAEGGTGSRHSEVVFRADSPLGPFEAWSGNPILTQRHLNPSRPDPVTCAGHADLVRDTDGSWWTVFLGCRPVNGDAEILGRETFIMPVEWSDDGFPVITSGSDVVPGRLSKRGVKRENDVTFGNFNRTDNFDSPVLGMEWMSLRGPLDSLCSLTEIPGFLQLRCSVNSTSRRSVPAFLSRRVQHHRFTATTRMHFSPEEGERAGMLLFKDESHQYFLAVGSCAGSGRQILLVKISAEGEKTLVSRAIDGDAGGINLMVRSYPESLMFCYSLADEPAEGKDWTILCENVDIQFLSTAEAGGFTGTNIGLYAHRQDADALAAGSDHKIVFHK